MSKNTIKINESQLRDIISKCINEAFNTGQYAYLAGRAQSQLDNNKMKGMLNPQWKARKQRQAELFGKAGGGEADSNNYTDNTQHGYAKVQNSQYDNDNYWNRYRPNGNGDGGPYKATRSQFNEPDGSGLYVQGGQNGQTASMDQINTMRQNGKIDGDQRFNLSMNNKYLNNQYNAGLKSGKQGDNGQFKNIKQWQVSESQLHQIVAESVKRALNEFEGGQNYTAMERMMFNVVCEEVDAPTVLHAIDAILGREQFHEVLDYLYNTSNFSRTAKPNWPKDHMASSMGDSTVES